MSVSCRCCAVTGLGPPSTSTLACIGRSGGSAGATPGEHIDAIALWLGHESPTTTHQYTEANLEMKVKALAKLQDPDTASRRFRASDSLLELLKGQ